MPWHQLYFSLNGRATRRDFWLRLWVPIMLAEIALVAALPPVSPFFEQPALTKPGGNAFPVLTPLGIAHVLVIILAVAVVAVKRLHDRGRSGWVLLVFAIPLPVAFLPGDYEPAGWLYVPLLVLVLAFNAAYLWFWIELGFLRGTHGPNRFGPDPLQPTEPQTATT